MSPRAHLEQHMVQRTGRVVLLRWGELEVVVEVVMSGGGEVRWWWRSSHGGRWR